MVEMANWAKIKGFSCFSKTLLKQNGKELLNQCLRPYHVENTGSRPITEVKPGRAGLVLGWVTAWEYPVL